MAAASFAAAMKDFLPVKIPRIARAAQQALARLGSAVMKGSHGMRYIVLLSLALWGCSWSKASRPDVPHKEIGVVANNISGNGVFVTGVAKDNDGVKHVVYLFWSNLQPRWLDVHWEELKAVYPLGESTVFVAHYSREGSALTAIDMANAGTRGCMQLGEDWYIEQISGSRNGKYACALLSANHPERMDLYLWRVIVYDRNNNTFMDAGSFQIGPNAVVGGCLITGDGGRVVVLGTPIARGCRIIDVRKKAICGEVLLDEEAALNAGVLRKDDKTLYCCGVGGWIHEVDLVSLKINRRFIASRTGKVEYGRRAYSIGLDDGDKVLSCGTGPEGDVFSWDVETGAARGLIQTGTGTIDSLAVSPDGQRVISRGTSSTGLDVWNIGDHR